MTEAAKNILSVTEVTRRIKVLLEREIGAVWVEGEVSNCRFPASGHCYFTLKDSSAQISAVMFKGDRRAGMKLADGMMVRVYGRATVYERGGNYQILVKVLEEAGKGDLQKQFEILKDKLRQEGLFDADRKRKLPMLPQHVGIVTSRTGAAVRDILNVISRRFPNLHIVLAPVKVQGDGAAIEIAQAIDDLNELQGLDVIIVGRGGGSIEDLWAFNEEPVARAIFRSKLPVISAVGHEIDFTIADFVADLRAPTPSAAAELVVGCKDDFIKRLNEISAAIRRILIQELTQSTARFRQLEGHYVFREPANLVRHYSERLNSIRLSLLNQLSGATREIDQRLDDASHRMVSGSGVRLEQLINRVEKAGGALRTMNPAGVLRRGYSITRDTEGRCLTSIDGIRKGARITTMLASGEILSTVENTLEP